ncbi:MAG: hypothetical protein ABJM43_11255 [Paracoccaceae bacterium]
MKRSIRGVFAQKTSTGARVTETTLAKTGLGNLPLDVSLIARIGSNAAPRAVSNGLILRPTVGLRLMSAALTLFLFWMAWFNPGAYLPDNVLILIPVTLAALYGFANTNLSFLRYNLDGFEVMDSLFRRRRIAWSDVKDIQDDGHYMYVFRLRSGSKVKALKYLGGMPEFLNHAFVEIDSNNLGPRNG